MGPENSRYLGLSRAAVVSGLIALTTLLGSIGAWRATEAGGAAAEAEGEALADQRNAAQQEAVIRASVAANEFAYARRSMYSALAEELRGQASSASDEATASSLQIEASAYETLADSIVVDPDAVTPDGALDLDSKFDIEWEAASLRQDLDPGPEFDEADGLRSKQEAIVGITALFVAAALFFTLSKVSRNEQGARMFLGGGLAVLGISVVLLLVQEIA